MTWILGVCKIGRSLPESFVKPDTYYVAECMFRRFYTHWAFKPIDWVSTSLPKQKWATLPRGTLPLTVLTALSTRRHRGPFPGQAPLRLPWLPRSLPSLLPPYGLCWPAHVQKACLIGHHARRCGFHCCWCSLWPLLETSRGKHWKASENITTSSNGSTRGATLCDLIPWVSAGH